MVLDMFAVIFGGAAALLPIYARDILQVGARGYGLLTSSLEIGALVTSAVLVMRRPIRRTGRALLLAVGVYGLATIAFGLSRWFPLSVAAYMLVGMADQVSVVMRSTAIQLSTPDELRGRVSAVNLLFIGASNQLGRRSPASSPPSPARRSPSWAAASDAWWCWRSWRRRFPRCAPTASTRRPRAPATLVHRAVRSRVARVGVVERQGLVGGVERQCAAHGEPDSFLRRARDEIALRATAEGQHGAQTRGTDVQHDLPGAGTAGSKLLEHERAQRPQVVPRVP